MNARRQPHSPSSESEPHVFDGDGDYPGTSPHLSIARSPDRLIPASEVPKHLPRSRRGKKIHRTTILRWMSGGCRGVVLGSLLVGGRRYTDLDSIERFISGLTVKFRTKSPTDEPGFRRSDAPTLGPIEPAKPVRTGVDRQAAIERDLRRFGL